MYLIDRDEGLTLQKLTKIIQQFRSNELVKINECWNYYKGKQRIMAKSYADTKKPVSKILTNHCKNIVNTFQGYLTGVDIKYSSNSDISNIIDILNYNDVRNNDNEYLRQALIAGRAFELCYIDEDGKNRFKVLDNRNCIPIYSNDLNKELLYVVYFYRTEPINKETNEFIVYLYGVNDLKIYKSNDMFSSFELLDEQKNFFNQVPITVFSLNEDETSAFGDIITLQDAYNELLSDEVSDFSAFCDAYLVLKGYSYSEEMAEQIEKMKENRVLVLNGENVGAEYLTKNINDTAISDMLQRINDNIHKIANCPDFNDKDFMAQSGIAMRYKLTNFEFVSSNIVANMTKALQRRIELLCSIEEKKGNETLWRDINIVFTRNLPVDLGSIAQEINQFRGLVSDKTLLSQIPFVKDVDAELEAIKKQREENIEVYDFGTIKDDEK